MTLMGIVSNLTGLVICRVFLGMLEAGYFPGVSFYLTLWYLQLRLARAKADCQVPPIRTCFAYCNLLFYGYVGRSFWWITCLWNWIYEEYRRVQEWMALDLYIGYPALPGAITNCLEGILTVLVSSLAPFFIRDVLFL